MIYHKRGVAWCFKDYIACVLMDGVETKMWLLLLIILCTEKFKKYVNTFLKPFHLIYKWKVSIHYITQTPFPLPPPGEP